MSYHDYICKTNDLDLIKYLDNNSKDFDDYLHLDISLLLNKAIKYNSLDIIKYILTLYPELNKMEYIDNCLIDNKLDIIKYLYNNHNSIFDNKYKYVLQICISFNILDIKVFLR